MNLVGRGKNRMNIDYLLGQVDSEAGTLAVISGPTGIGKSTLLRVLTARARAAGATVLGACALREERDEDFAIVQQLFTLRYQPDTIVTDVTGDSHTADWLQVAERARLAITALAENGPVVLVIDDIHHADPLSVRCLRYLTARTAPQSLSLSVIVSWDATAESTSPILQEILYESHVNSISLEPLNFDAVVELIATMDTETANNVDAESAALYHELTGGNPLLIFALMQDRQELDTLDSGSGGSVSGPVAGDAFQRAVQVCLHRMGPLARQVAQGVALLGEGADEYQLSELCETSLGVVRTTVQRLQASGLLMGCAFRHQRVREIVLDTIPSDTVIELHHRAARLLHVHGASPEAIAFHLVVAGPVKDEWGLPVLRDAAQQVLSAGKTELGIQYLKLADASCTDDITRYEIKAQLAEVCSMVEVVGAAARYQSLKTPILTGLMAPATALPVAQAMLWNAQVHDAVEVIDSVARQADPSRPGVAIEMQLTELQIASSFPGVQRTATVTPPVDSVSAAAAYAASPAIGARLRAHQSLLSVLTGKGDAYTAAQAQQSLQAGSLLDESVRACVVPTVLTLIYSSFLDSAQLTASCLLEDALDHGLPGWTTVLHGLLGMIALRRGELDVAVEHTSAAVAETSTRSLDSHGWLALATLAEAHTSIGNHEKAAQCFATAAAPALFQTRSGLHYLYARGRHHLAGGRPYAALADFTTCGEQMQQWNLDAPVLVPWRVGAAEAWLSLDQRQKASALLEEQLAMRGFGTARSRGMALRALAATGNFKDRLTILNESLQLLQASGDRYEMVRTLADLSSAHRAIGDKDKARTAALRARRMAKACHADTLSDSLMVATARFESTAEWSTPKEHGFDKLSKSEQRVATLAARGLTNREIAEELFVTVSTVEQHLTHVYKKMNVRSREDLPVKLRVYAA